MSLDWTPEASMDYARRRHAKWFAGAQPKPVVIAKAEPPPKPAPVAVYTAPARQLDRPHKLALRTDHSQRLALSDPDRRADLLAKCWALADPLATS